MNSNSTVLTVTIDEGIFRPTPFVGTYATSTDHLLHSGPRLLLISLRSPMPNALSKVANKSLRGDFCWLSAMMNKRSGIKRKSMKVCCLITRCNDTSTVFTLCFFFNLLFCFAKKNPVLKIFNLIFFFFSLFNSFLFTLYVFIHLGVLIGYSLFFLFLQLFSPRTPHVYFFFSHSSLSSRKKSFPKYLQ